ncbi:MAG TPA: hypothetical protein VK886_09770 [Vicinamibacterales bacterium]|nr:hypothetical protein [Vicinamibacterales bacterium]
MFTLKPLALAAIPQALAKAERYRLLNEAWEAESICLDVLDVEPDNQDALVMLILALTDQFRQRAAEGTERARALLPKLRQEYQRAYYEGIIWERRAKALLDADHVGSAGAVYDWLRDAMDCFDRAAAHRPAGNDDAILRWNTCVRMLARHPQLAPSQERYEPQMLE